MTTLQTITMELQKTYSCPPAMTYTPCVGEVCAVQFSSDMVSKDTFKRVVKMQLHRITDCCLCFLQMRRTGTEAWSRLWPRTRRRPISFTLTLAMRKMSLWKGSSHWLLKSRHFFLVYVQSHINQISWV